MKMLVTATPKDEFSLVDVKAGGAWVFHILSPFPFSFSKENKWEGKGYRKRSSAKPGKTQHFPSSR